MTCNFPPSIGPVLGFQFETNDSRYFARIKTAQGEIKVEVLPAPLEKGFNPNFGTDGWVPSFDLSKKVAEWKKQVENVQLATDYQPFVRQVTEVSKEIVYGDVWEQVFTHNFDQMGQRVKNDRLTNQPPFVAIRSTGIPAKDKLLLDTFISRFAGTNCAAQEQLLGLFGFQIAVAEKNGLSKSETNEPYYNLAMRKVIAMQRERLEIVKNLREPSQIRCVEEYEVPFLPAEPEVLVHVGPYAKKHLSHAQRRVLLLTPAPKAKTGI